jgi:ribulose-5-phosphate 4-epimerase/fuculose-1-phosphate aldolase
MSDLIELARDEICRVGASLFARGYVHASAGNISARVGDEYLVTPTDAPMGFLEAEQISHVDGVGHLVSGGRASKALVLHRRIYATDPQATFVIHTHSTHLVALTLTGVWSDDDILPPISPYFVMKVGHVPLIPYHRPGDPAVADLVAARIAERADDAPIRAVMLDRLGPVVWGPNPAAAMAVLEELEETARLWMLTGRQAAPLPPSAIQELKKVFSAAW